MGLGVKPAEQVGALEVSVCGEDWGALRGRLLALGKPPLAGDWASCSGNQARVSWTGDAAGLAGGAGLAGH